MRPSGRARRRLVKYLDRTGLFATNASIRTSIALVCGLLGLSSAAPVWAQAGAAPIARTPLRIELQPEASCTSADAFFAELTARAPNVRRAKPDEDAAELVIELESDAGTRGRLQLLEGRGRTTERVVEASSCREAVDALVLVAAVLLDPAALAEREPLLQPASPSPLPKPPVTRPPIVGSRYAFGFATGGALQGGVAPSVQPAEWLEASLVRSWGAAPRELFALAAWHTSTTRTNVPAGRAAFSWSALRATGCPLAAELGVVVRPCAALDAGFIDASGDQTHDQRAYHALWLALDASARVELRLLGPLRLAVEGGVTVPLTRSKFFFQPQVSENTAFNVPALRGFGALGLGARF